MTPKRGGGLTVQPSRIRRMASKSVCVTAVSTISYIHTVIYYNIYIYILYRSGVPCLSVLCRDSIGIMLSRHPPPLVEIPGVEVPVAEETTFLDDLTIIPPKKPSLFRRNTSKDLRNSIPIPPIRKSDIPRPQSARVRNSGGASKFDIDDPNCSVALYEESYGGRSSTFDREYEARHVPSNPVIMSPETISRCICVLIMELMEDDESTAHGEILSALTPIGGPTSEKAFFSSSPSKPSQYEVFRRDYKKKAESLSHSGGHTRFSPVKLTSFFATARRQVDPPPH